LSNVSFANGTLAPQFNNKVIRRKFVVATTAIGSAICLLFFFNLLYLYGSVYHQEYRYQALDCLMVDDASSSFGRHPSVTESDEKRQIIDWILNCTFDSSNKGSTANSGYSMVGATQYL
jgi:hypothetical protein